MQAKKEALAMCMGGFCTDTLGLLYTALRVVVSLEGQGKK